MSNKTVETTGASLAEARQAAAKQLGVAEDKLQVEVLEESKGLFGRGQFRIRAVAGAAVAAVEVATEEPKPKRASRAKKVAEPVEEPEAVEEEAPVEEVVAEVAPAKKPRARLGAKAAEAEVAEAPAPAAAAPARGREERVDHTDTIATDKDAKALLKLVKDLLASANLDVTAKVDGMQGRYVNIEIDGDDVAHLIGKHGEVLNATQYLANIIASRQLDSGARVVLDGGNYRRKREEALTGLATKIAEAVRERGEEAVLDALPAFERRIVHKALGEIKGVTTYSEGEEPNRRVVIAPAE